MRWGALLSLPAIIIAPCRLSALDCRRRRRRRRRRRPSRWFEQAVCIGLGSRSEGLHYL